VGAAGEREGKFSFEGDNAASRSVFAEHLLRVPIARDRRWAESGVL